MQEMQEQEPQVKEEESCCSLGPVVRGLQSFSYRTMAFQSVHLLLFSGALGELLRVAKRGAEHTAYKDGNPIGF